MSSGLRISISSSTPGVGSRFDIAAGAEIRETHPGIQSLRKGRDVLRHPGRVDHQEIAGPVSALVVVGRYVIEPPDGGVLSSSTVPVAGAAGLSDVSYAVTLIVPGATGAPAPDAQL